MSKKPKTTRTSTKIGELAFEHNVPECLTRIWRVFYIRVWNETRNRASEWYGNESEAYERAGDLSEAGHDVISVKRFVCDGEKR